VAELADKKKKKKKKVPKIAICNKKNYSSPLDTMPQTKKSQKVAAARAHMARYQKKAIPSDLTLEQSDTDNIHNPAIECTG
jgi:hypothetical protein